MKTFTLLFFLLTANPFFAGPPTPTETVSIAYSFLGKKVKTGKCSDFVVKVVSEVKDEKYKTTEENLYGKYLIEKDRVAVKPGDIVRFKNYKCGEWSFPKHIAIVSKITPEGIFILHQNIDGSPVIETLLCEEEPTGTITFYSVLGIK